MRIDCWKNIISVILAFLLMAVCGSCVDKNMSNVDQSTSDTDPPNIPPESPKTWRLIVLDEEIPYSQIVEDEQGRPCVPITCVLVKYGYKVTWETDEKAKITKGNKVYIFDLSKESLFEEGAGESANLIGYVGGGSSICSVINKDMLVDPPNMGVILDLIGEDGRCDWSTEKKYVRFGFTSTPFPPIS